MTDATENGTGIAEDPHTRRSGPAWLIAVGWIVVSGALLAWIRGTPNGVMRDELRRWQFWSLETLFLGLLALSVVCMPRLLKRLSLRATGMVVPLAAALVSFALTTFVAPKTNRIYFDEHIYQSIGQNLSDLHLAQMCNDGNVEYGALQCWRGEYNKEPYAYPYLLSVAYRLVGVHEDAAFVVNTVAEAALVLLVFVMTLALTGRTDAAQASSLIAALIPEQLRWGHSAAAEPTAALACAFAVVTALAFVRSRETLDLAWMVLATAFAVQFRPECMLAVPLVLAVIVIFAPGELLRRRVWAAGAIGLLLLGVHLAHLSAVSGESWGAAGPRFSTAYFVNNLRANGGFFAGDPRFPMLYSILAVAGLVAARKRWVLVPLLYFMLFWGVFLFFYAGSYNYGADDRFSLMAYAPVAVLAGVGASALARRLSAYWSVGRLAGLVVAAVVCAQFLWYVPLVRSVGEEAWAARADVAFARSVLGDLPPNSIVLTHNPNMFHLWRQSAAQASIATAEPGYVEQNLVGRYAGGVFFHWNFWCDVADPVQQAFCRTILERYPHTLVREYRERDYRYALYRIDRAVAASPASTP